jgi:hypothetical protein
MKIETYLPIFPGFYNTLFESDEDNEIFSINQDRISKYLPEIGYDDCEWDYEDYRQNVSKECTSYIETELQDIFKDKNIKVKFQELRSPKEYNFENDSINVEISMSKKTLGLVKKYLTDEMEAFSEYIKDRYTSYDGFLSSYSNDAETWLSEYFDEIFENVHYFGAILEFIFKNEEVTYYDMYYGIETHYATVTNYDTLMKK